MKLLSGPRPAGPAMRGQHPHVARPVPVASAETALSAPPAENRSAVWELQHAVGSFHPSAPGSPHRLGQEVGLQVVEFHLRATEDQEEDRGILEHKIKRGHSNARVCAHHRKRMWREPR